MSLYLDTSCLWKLLVEEPESARVRELIGNEPEVVISSYAEFEAEQVLRALRRAGTLTARQEVRLGRVLADLRLGMLACRDVRVQRDEADARHRYALHPQHLSRRTHALEIVRLEAARGDHTLGHVRIGVARAVLAARGVVADEGFEGGAGVGERGGEVEQAQEGLVPGQQAQILVDQREALVDQV